MHLLVTGGRSNLARSTVEMLLAEGHRVSWLGPNIRPASPGRFHHLTQRHLPWRAIDFRGLDGLVHLAGPHPAAHLTTEDLRRTRDFERGLFARAADAGVDRVMFVGVVSNPRVRELPFVRLKWQTESLLRESGLPATVFRVPWLYGPDDDFLTRLWRWVRNRSFLLVPGLSEAPVQLCSERRLAEAILRAVNRTPSQLRIYEAATATPLPLGELIAQLGRIVRGEPALPRAVGDRAAFHLRGPLRVVGLIPIRSPMWALLQGGMTCATAAWERDFDVQVQSGPEAIVEFVREMDATASWWTRSVSLPRLAIPR